MTTKIKRAGTDNAHVVIVLDASSSMNVCRDETIQGVNLFLKQQRESEIKTAVSLYTFNGTEVNCVANKVSASEVSDLSKVSYRPQGMTNLLDAVGKVINTINEQLSTAKKAERPSVEVCIVTDGEENMSRSFTAAQIRELKASCELKDWTFTFMGANIDAFAEGSKLGFNTQNTYQFNQQNITQSMSVMSGRTEAVKRARSLGLDTVAVYSQTELSDAERDELNK